MLRKLRQNRGFTLIELLVVILLVAILAAIAIPAYLGHQKKGQDSEAQSNARNLSSRIELCYATEEDYTQCDTHAKLGNDTNLPYGTGPGQVHIVTTGKDTYLIRAYSKAKSNDSNHTFSIEHKSSGINERTCTAGTTNANGACRNGVW